MLNRKFLNVTRLPAISLSLWAQVTSYVSDIILAVSVAVLGRVTRQSDLYLLVVFSLLVWCCFAVAYPSFAINFYMGRYTTDEVRLGIVMLVNDLPAALWGYWSVGISLFFIAWRNFLSACHTNLGWLFTNPLKDIDLSVNTDFEDSLAFLADITEFVEQDKSFLLDFMFNFSSTTLAGGVGVGLFAIALSKLPHSAALTKLFW